MERFPVPKTWRLRDHEPPPECAAWADSLGVQPLLASILWQRGLQDLKSMETFLSPGLRHLVHPTAIPGMEEAANVLAGELVARKKVAIWGDYDVDGVTSTALIVDYLRRRGLECIWHIPDRRAEGYGLNPAGVEELAERGAEVLITVDCGVTAHEAVGRARELGMTVVVSDHHLPGDTLPPAHALTNPRLPGCPCPDLAGVGVAFFLMARVNALLPGERPDMRDFLDLVALGTLADVVPLRDQNRILVKNGLLKIAQAARPGLRALKEAAGYHPLAAVTSGQVIFGLAPRINAAGRIGSAEDAVRMLLAADLDEARPIAQRLDELNRERQDEEERISQEAMDQALDQARKRRFGLVLASEGWHPGIIGIVASRVVERFYRPTVILTSENGQLKGSARSIREFDLFSGLKETSGLLTRFGGHRLAAGLALDPANLEDFHNLFDDVVKTALKAELPSPTLSLDAPLSFADVNHRLLKELDLLQPFGPGNPEPSFLSGPVRVTDHRAFGKKREHAILTVRDEAAGLTMRAKAWRMAELAGPHLVGETLRLAFQPRLDTYGGMATLEVQLKDLQIDRESA